MYLHRVLFFKNRTITSVFVILLLYTQKSSPNSIQAFWRYCKWVSGLDRAGRRESSQRGLPSEIRHPHNGLFFPPRLWGFNLSALALFTHIRLQKGEVKRSLIQHMKLCEWKCWHKLVCVSLPPSYSNATFEPTRRFSQDAWRGQSFQARLRSQIAGIPGLNVMREAGESTWRCQTPSTQMLLVC